MGNGLNAEVGMRNGEIGVWKVELGKMLSVEFIEKGRTTPITQTLQSTLQRPC
jgi:hypothetical protein